MQNAKDSKMTLMRLGWWREALNEICRVPPQQPWQSPEPGNEGQGLEKKLFVDAVEAPEIAPAAETAVLGGRGEEYSELAWSSNLILNLELMGQSDDAYARHAASHIGKALGICQVKSNPLLCLKRTTLPSCVSACYQSCVVRGRARGRYPETLANAIYELANIAYGHVEQPPELANEAKRGIQHSPDCNRRCVPRKASASR